MGSFITDGWQQLILLIYPNVAKGGPASHHVPPDATPRSPATWYCLYVEPEPVQSLDLTAHSQEM